MTWEEGKGGREREEEVDRNGRDCHTRTGIDEGPVLVVVVKEAGCGAEACWPSSNNQHIDFLRRIERHDSEEEGREGEEAEAVSGEGTSRTLKIEKKCEESCCFVLSINQSRRDCRVVNQSVGGTLFFHTPLCVVILSVAPALHDI